jgi:hypothetical protein
MQAEAAAPSAAAAPAVEAAGQEAAATDEAPASTQPAASVVQQEGGSPPTQPVPLPYLVDADGKKQPLPGSKSIFIRGKLFFRPRQGFGCSTRQHKRSTAWATHLAVACTADSMVPDMHPTS